MIPAIFSAVAARSMVLCSNWLCGPLADEWGGKAAQHAKCQATAFSTNPLTAAMNGPIETGLAR